jgi:hypothetical protein
LYSRWPGFGLKPKLLDGFFGGAASAADDMTPSSADEQKSESNSRFMIPPSSEWNGPLVAAQRPSAKPNAKR